LQAATLALGFSLEDAKAVLDEADQDKEGSLDCGEFEQLLKRGMGKLEEDCTVTQVSR
jgi:hypothetical protein